jgi:hypothetical protein
LARITRPPTRRLDQTWLTQLGRLLDAVAGPLPLGPFNVANLPSAEKYEGSILFVPDAAGEPCAAVSDGANWRRLGDPGDASLMIKAVTMIPAATEWAYAPYEIFRDYITSGAEFITTQNGFSVYPESQWTLLYGEAASRIGAASCDWKTSLDAMQAQLPNVKTVNLFVSWYGDDLRAGSCALSPGVTRNSFADMPHEWACAGYSRATARLISTASGGSVAYGGTPDDQSVIDAIKDMHARGLRVCFTPFILMDIPAGNTLPDPYSGGTGQAVYPWRGRITKAYGTGDKTAAVATEVAAFVAQYRAFVLHYADLCASAGGVEVFILGTELRGLTWLRDAYASHPFVTALKTLAADVRAILPASKITYAADWSEFTPFQASDGVTFHLDPLWSDANIDALSIDVYWPLSDWRDGTTHADYVEGREVADADYLMSNIKGGEGYDWYYASDADRAAQTRTEITDWWGFPFVFRYKDIWGWWENQHFDRPSWTPSATPTAWVPKSKPIWFTELGYPSIDKGPNQPNVFYDPKSSESAFPYYSSGDPDNLVQDAALRAMLRFINPDDAEFVEANNPQSDVYDGRMIDLDHVMVYTWDARPYPTFPDQESVWADGPNYTYGHWVEGKIARIG